LQKLNKEIIKKKNIKGALLFFALLFYTFSFSQNEKKPKDLSKIVKTWAQPDVYPDHVVLSVAEDPTTAIGINWRTSPTDKIGYVEIAVSYGTPYFATRSQRIKAEKINYDTSINLDDGFESSFYGITIKDLKPNTLYAYRVGNDLFKSEWFQFKTAGNPKKEPYSFIYVGDAQNYILELWSRLIRTAFKTMPEAKFVIHAGDLVNYAHSETEWNDWFDAGGFIHSEIPTIAIPGNHEYSPYIKGRNVFGEKQFLSMQWQRQFSFPENGPKKLKKTCYFIDYPDLKVIALNSNLEIKLQSKWLKNVLAQNNKKWIVVTYHHPAFSASRKEGNEEIIKYWKPLFEEYNVDLALQGHDHAYTRGAVYTKELKSEYLKGPVYVVSVSGGKMYKLSSEGWDKYGAIKNKKGQYLQLFQVITIDDNKLFYKSYTASGKLFDNFELNKKEGKTQYLK